MVSQCIIWEHLSPLSSCNIYPLSITSNASNNGVMPPAMNTMVIKAYIKVSVNITSPFPSSKSCNDLIANANAD